MLIGPDHNLADFDSGEPTLDKWLKKRALKNSAGGALRGFVISPLQPMTLMMTMATVQTILREPDEPLRAGHAGRSS
ncbi:MAG TPA: hypothetical protein VGL97_23370 [Bryobacteraceae bacterium]